MLEYARTDLSEEIDIYKTTDSCECNICHYWYFLKTNIKYQPKVCNGFHDIM